MRIVMFVRNAVTHDARVLREADTLAAAGHEVTIVGREDRPDVPGATVEVRGRVRILRVPSPPGPLRRWRMLRTRPWGILRELWGDVRAAVRARPPWAAAIVRAAATGVLLLPWTAVRGLVRAVRGPSPARPADAIDWLATWRFAVGAWAEVAADAVPAADAWHGHDLSGMLAAARARRRAGGALVFDAHEILLESRSSAARPRWARAVVARAERKAYREADALVTVNDAIAAELVRRYGRPRRTVILHNTPARWTPPSEPGNGPLRAALGIDAATPLLLYHGGFSAERGLEQLAAAALHPALAGVHVAYLGYGSMLGWLEERAADPAYGGRLHVLPAVPPEALLRWVADADAGVMASLPTTLNHRLATPNKLFECLAAGVPVVAGDLPGLLPIVRDGPGGPVGVVADSADPAAIAEAAAGLLALDPAARTELRARCLRVAHERWNWETESAGLVALYADLAPVAAPAAPRPTTAPATRVPVRPELPPEPASPSPAEGPEAAGLRVLTVSRWYPSHDLPGRAPFVADLVGATVARGVDARVVSFDRVLVRGAPETRDGTRRAARAAFDAVTTPEVAFVVPGGLAVPAVPVARLPVVRRPGADVDATLEDHVDALRPFLTRLLATWRPDVIHAHTGLPDGIVAARVGRELGIPVVVSEHASTLDAELASPVARERYRELLSPGVRLVAVSPAIAERMGPLLGVPPERIGLLPNPVPDATFLAGELPRDPDLLLWVGNLGAHKGIELLLRAIARARADRPHLRLRCIGGEHRPGDLARWTALAETLGIRGAVAFDGWLDRGRIAAAMRVASVLVHASPYETFGVTAAEAILSGLPVACRPGSGGVPWIVGLSGGFGAVADGDDDEALARAVLAVLDGPLAVDAATARERLAAAVAPDAVAAAAIAEYERALEEAGPGAQRVGSNEVPDAPPAAPVPLVVAGSGREEAFRLAGLLPAGLRAAITLVVPAAPEPAAPPALRVVEVRAPSPGGRGRRGGLPSRILRRLARTVRGDRRRVRAEADAWRAAIRAAVAGNAPAGATAPGDAAAADAPPGRVGVVAIDAPAAATVAWLAHEGIRLAPGSLRWLADRWLAEHGPAEHGDAAPGRDEPAAG